MTGSGEHNDFMLKKHSFIILNIYNKSWIVTVTVHDECSMIKKISNCTFNFWLPLSSPTFKCIRFFLLNVTAKIRIFTKLLNCTLNFGNYFQLFWSNWYKGVHLFSQCSIRGKVWASYLVMHCVFMINLDYWYKPIRSFSLKKNWKVHSRLKCILNYPFTVKNW